MRRPSIILFLSGLFLFVLKPVSAQESQDLRPFRAMPRSEFRAIALAQIEKLRAGTGGWPYNPGGFEPWFVRYKKEYPAKTLKRMGLETIPILAEFLEDWSPTKVYKYDPDRGLFLPNRPAPTPDQSLKFAQLIAFTIRDVAEATYPYRGTWQSGLGWLEIKDTKLMSDFKTAALKWYAENRNLPPEFHFLKALPTLQMGVIAPTFEWLADNQITLAVDPITERIRTMTSGKIQNEHLDGYISSAAVALGKIGDPHGLSGAVESFEWQLENFTDMRRQVSDKIQMLFQTGEARLRLGDDKTKVAGEFERLYDRLGTEWPATTVSFYLKEMQSLRRGLPIRWEYVAPEGLNLAGLKKMPRLGE